MTATTETRTCAFITYGCKINQYDTQAIREEILSLGYVESDSDRGLDLVVVNSCTVTARAGQKMENRVRTLARRNPRATIIVTGCLTEDDRTRLTSIPQVEHLIGNEEKDLIPAIVQGRSLPGERRARRADRHIFDLGVSRFHGHTRAFLKVHDGCDSFCAYCVIPYLRGGSRSRAPEDVVREAGRLADAGHRELVLTGIHLRRYGLDVGCDDGLGMLLTDLRAIPGIDRVRLSSIGEGAFTDAFLDRFRDDPGLCPFFHVPLQSGSDSVLERMRRDYTRAEFLDAIDRIRAALPDALVATDLMVGFPGETEEEFEESLETCRRARFAKIHIFPYSPRPRTRAARLPDPVPDDVKRERVLRARAVGNELARDERERRLGARMQVLVERREERGVSGLSREGFRVLVPSLGGAPLERGEEVTVQVTATTDDGLEAAPVGGDRR